jgi:3-methylcrotonyl-CoA carboxylase beta subunit
LLYSLFENTTLMATSKQQLEFNYNEDKMRQLVSEMNQKLQKIYLGGGKSKIESHHAKGKLTARERIECLLTKVLKPLK